jgi:hypothetical protein
MNLEQIIRPFQDRGITPPVRFLEDRDDKGPENVQFGAGGGKIFLYATFASTGVSELNDYKEVSRETKEKRVENPDDPDQYVNIKVTEKLYTRNEVDPSKKLNIKFADQDD